jgi:hypothetical protein
MIEEWAGVVVGGNESGAVAPPPSSRGAPKA